MNLSSLLQVPWRSSQTFMRWFSLVLFVLCCGGAIAFGLFATKADRWEGAVGIYGVGLVYLWAFFFSTSLLLAIEARQLRIPGLQRHAAWSLVLHGLLCIGLPVVALGLCGQPILHAAILLALFCGGGLLFALVPRYVAVFLGLTPALSNALLLRFDLPGIGDPRFDSWAGIAALLILALDVLRWHQILRADYRSLQGWSSPMVMLSGNSSWGRWGLLGSLGDNRLLRQSPDWLQMNVDLDGVGPAMPRKALRVALGGWYLPQTIRSYAKQLICTFAFLLLPLLGVLLLAHAGHQDAQVADATYVSDVLKGFFVRTLAPLSIFAGPMVCLLSLLWLARRWQRVNAELPLLALLPGLGDSTRVKQQLLCVALGLPMVFHALLVVSTGIAMLFWHGHVGLLECMLVAQLGTTAVTATGVLNLFGGYGLKNWTAGAVAIAIFVLTLLSLILPAVAWGRYPVAWVVNLFPLLGLAWLLLASAMFMLGRRGWRGLQARPHPFLPA